MLHLPHNAKTQSAETVNPCVLTTRHSAGHPSLANPAQSGQQQCHAPARKEYLYSQGVQAEARHEGLAEPSADTREYIEEEVADYGED